MAAIAPEEWARVWAHAWLDEGFKERLGQNPKTAAEEFHKQFKIAGYDQRDRLFALDRLFYADLVNKTDAQLTEIMLQGKLNGEAFIMGQNDWTPIP